MITSTVFGAAGLFIIFVSLCRLYWQTGERWHVVEVPAASEADQYGHAKQLNGQLAIAVTRRHSKVMPVGVCDFDDDETAADLRVKAETRAAHLNRTRQRG